MSDYNNVVLAGRCGDAPEVFRGDGKQPFAKVQIATNKKWRKDNVVNTRTDWHTVMFSRKLAELAEKYLHKGDLILVDGELRSNKWQDKHGKTQYSVYVQAKELRFLTPKAKHETKPTTGSAQTDSSFYETADGLEEEYEHEVP